MVVEIKETVRSRMLYGIRVFWRTYTYFYYWIYAWNLRAWGEKDSPQYNAMFGISFMGFINIITLLIGGGVVLEINEIFNLKKGWIIFVSLIILIFNYYGLVYRKKYKIIAAHFSKEQESIRRKKSIICWLYVLVSFGLAVFVTYVVKAFRT